MNRNDEMNEKQVETVEEKKESGKATAFWQKASDFGKKAADGIQKGAKVVADKTKEELYAQRLKKYKPLFAKEYKSKGFSVADIIQIIDNDELQKIDVCEGAIGWRETVSGVEILHLSDEWIKSSGLEFVPFAKCNETFCVDAFARSRYIKAENVFGKAHEERLAELERIAYMLGAKKCSIEIVESDCVAESTKIGMKVDKNTASAGIGSASKDQRSGKTVASFQGSDEPRRPELKWFSQDENIKNLIEMRCSDKNSIKSRVLALEGSSSATMSQSIACALDCVLKSKIGISMEREAIKEHSSKLIFEVEF